MKPTAFTLRLRKPALQQHFEDSAQVGAHSSTDGDPLQASHFCAVVVMVATMAFAACAGEPPAVPPPSMSAADSLLGTWRVARFATKPGQDTTQGFPYGVEPRGYLVYDATHHVFFQSMRPAAMDSLKLGWRRSAPDSILLRLVTDGYIAYFGKYEVDTLERTIMHKIEGELRPRGGSYEMATPYRFDNDTLVISGWHFVRVQ